MLSRVMVKIGLWLIYRAPASWPKGRALAKLCGLSDQIMDAVYPLIGHVEKFDSSGAHRRHVAMTALLNQGFNERDAGLAIEIAVRVVT